MIKSFDESDVKKTGFTRMTGALLAHQRAYVVYNTRNELMKGFEGGSEIKAWYSVGNIAAFNADWDNGTDHLPAIMFGKSYDIAVTMLKTYDEQFYKYKRVRRRGRTYEYVHFFTLDTNGVRQLRIMKYLGYERCILGAMFDEIKWRNEGEGLDYEFRAEGKYWFSFLTGDICRLLRRRREYVRAVRDTLLSSPTRFSKGVSRKQDKYCHHNVERRRKDTFRLKSVLQREF